MLAGCCTNAIGASVKQGEVKKQEVAVLYLADYPHASSRLQGERADSLNRQEQAAHRPHDTQFAEHSHTHTHTHSQQLYTTLFLHTNLQNIWFFFGRSFGKTHKQSHKAFIRRIKVSGISKLFRLEILYKQARFMRRQTIISAGELNTSF